MTMVRRQIVGYDPKTERVSFEHYIPPDKWCDVFALVRNNPNDFGYIYTYPIDIAVANDIMGLVGFPGKRVAQNLKYYLECEVP
jgi:hypothetical protein